MSINACSINESTINSLCGRRRQAIIDSLLPPVVIGGGAHPQHVRADTRVPLNIFRRDVDERDTVDVNTLELPFVQVTVEFAGHISTQTLDRNNFTPLVTVYSLSFPASEEAPTINISDIKFRTL